MKQDFIFLFIAKKLKPEKLEIPKGKCQKTTYQI